jgi:peptidoglycan/LPS O-acetylase OafA/YrhL
MLTDRPQLAALTSLRFITALHVFFFHIESAHILYAPGASNAHNVFNPARLLASIGYVGVNWFFLLSGFILAYSYAGRSFTLGGFWRARLVRIYPAYFVSLCLAAPLFIYVCFYMQQPPEQSGIAGMRDHIFAFMFLALVLMQSWVPAAVFSINPVGWSLSVEAFFYLLFPLFIAWLAGFSRRALLWTVLGLSLASVAMALAYVRWSPDGIAHVTPDMNHLPWLNALRFNPLVRLPEFLVGVCGALLFLQNAKPSRWATPLVAGGLVVFAVATLYTDQIPYPVMHNGLLSLPFLAIIYGIALRPSWIAILEWRVFRTLGEVSYSFFLTHGIVIMLYFRPDGKQPEHSIVEVLLCLALSLALAFALYQWVEQPMRRRFSSAKTKPQTPAKAANGN